MDQWTNEWMTLGLGGDGQGWVRNVGGGEHDRVGGPGCGFGQLQELR